MSIFSLLAWLNLIFGVIGLGFGLFTWNLGLLVIAAVTMAQSAAWGAVDKMSDEVESLRNRVGTTE